jgi:hypothetical protein
VQEMQLIRKVLLIVCSRIWLEHKTSGAKHGQ